MSKTVYIINPASATLVGIVANVKNITLNDQLAVTSAKDLESLTNGQLAQLSNSITGAEIKPFKIAKSAAAEKVFAVIQGADPSTVIHLDAKEQAAVVKQAGKVKVAEAAGDGTRKVRDSKLQRMAAAFRNQGEDGSYKPWTVKELMEACGTSEKITHQYISILRAQNDRFIMNIVKDKETKTFTFQPTAAK